MKKSISLFYLALFLFIFVCVSPSLTFSASETKLISNSDKSSDKSEIKWLAFSESNYQYERNLISKYEHVPKKEAKYTQIFISTAKLGDGIKGIFMYTSGPYFCGQIGCPFNIFKIENGKLISLLPPQFLPENDIPLFINTDRIQKQSVIGILPSKTMGFNDIFLRYGENKSIEKWNGKFYEEKNFKNGGD